MWMITTRGFFSAVESREDPDVLLIRARVKDDLEGLRDLLPGLEVIANAGTDYAWRIRVTRAEWARVCSSLALDIDYRNFKDAVTDRQGKRRHDVYMRVWSILYGLQTRPPRTLTRGGGGRGRGGSRAARELWDDGWPADFGGDHGAEVG